MLTYRMHNLSLNSMESSICLRSCTFPYGSKGFEGVRPSKFHHLRFNNAIATPLCVPQISTTKRIPVTRSSFGHANCMLGRFSENEGISGNKIMRGVSRVSLVLACVVGLFNFSGKMNPKLASASASVFDMIKSPTTQEPHQGRPDLSMFEESSPKGRVVLNSLLKTMRDAEHSEKQIKNHPAFKTLDPSQIQVTQLKLVAIGQRESRNARDALKKLVEQYDNCKKKGFQEETQNLEMALVEIYILKGNFEAALKVLNEQIGPESSLEPNAVFSVFKKYSDADVKYEEDRWARLILYKAIVHTMLKQVEADNWWEVFIRTCEAEAKAKP